ncbi:FAD-dependent oxidoreductase [Chloroflexota bacterium]
MVKLEKLFQPIKIGDMELPNRIVMSAVTTHYDYEENDRFINFYAERARGGVGLIVLGAYQTILPGRKVGTNRVNLYSDRFIPEMQKWVKVIHQNGAKVAAQMVNYNYISLKGPEGTAEEVGPSAVVLPREGTHPNHSLAEYLPTPRELTIDEIHMIEDLIGDAAVRVREAGFDAIDFQCVGGNIFNRFLNPFTNIRKDQYGGSVENRMRFVREAITNIKGKIGDDFPILARICGDDLIPHGLDLEGWQEIAPLFEQTGIHALNVYPGWHESRTPRAQMCVSRGGFVPLATGIKEVVTIPVIATMRINDPLLAEQIITEGKADMVTMTRPCIADPEMPNKAKAGRLDDILMCTACCYCYDKVLSGKDLVCSVNARVGKEGAYQVIPAKQRKKVFVIGGGPGGMEAARVAALRGHEVTLFEKQGRLGGQLLAAVMPPYKDEWNTTIKYYATQLTRLKVTVKLNEEATAAMVLAETPDAVIVATGSKHIVPKIPGIKGKNVATAVEVLTGQKQIGQKAVIIGGGSVGCETAEFLTQKGKRVTILEMLRVIGADYGPVNRFVVIDRLVETGIRMETLAKAAEITEKGIRVSRGSGSEFFEADSVIIAVGMLPADSISPELEGKISGVYQVGDCGKPANVKDAIESGFCAGAQV